MKKFKKRLMKADQVRFERIKSYLVPGKVLNLGSDATELHEYLVENSDNMVVGVDIKNRSGMTDLEHDLNEGIPTSRESYDVVVAGEIIEHLRSPSFFLEEIYRVLKPGGRLILTTPNMVGVQYIFANVKKESEKLVELADESDKHMHLHYFDEPSLRYILAKTGFNILVFKKLCNFYRFNPIKIIGILFYKLRPTLFVVAEK